MCGFRICIQSDLRVIHQTLKTYNSNDMRFEKKSYMSESLIKQHFFKTRMLKLKNHVRDVSESLRKIENTTT